MLAHPAVDPLEAGRREGGACGAVDLDLLVAQDLEDVAGDEPVARRVDAVRAQARLGVGDQVGTRLDAGHVRGTGLERGHGPAAVVAGDVEHAGALEEVGVLGEDRLVAQVEAPAVRRGLAGLEEAREAVEEPVAQGAAAGLRGRRGGDLARCRGRRLRLADDRRAQSPTHRLEVHAARLVDRVHADQGTPLTARRQRGEVGVAALREGSERLEVGRPAHQLREGGVLPVAGGPDLARAAARSWSA